MNANDSLYQIDEIDRRIIAALQEDARLTVRQLAARVHLTSTPVYERLKRLETQGIIRGYRVEIDSERVGMGFTVFCQVKLQRINAEIHTDFAARVAEIPSVTECYNISGSFDYMLKICVPDMAAYHAFVVDTLGRIPGVSSVESVFVMKKVKSSPCLPLG